ncbi:uncharacterized protein TrAFT101_001832 [Trichoderma asperellum]|uniref:uncharacterized protein n=1 Tax=Trichoderma asperellum TaxID=101201 RepID=UPI003320365B|nr:hypothetical protein TrAFT101_001832 [Trichoderma asperellum]
MSTGIEYQPIRVLPKNHTRAAALICYTAKRPVVPAAVELGERQSGAMPRYPDECSTTLCLAYFQSHTGS